MFARPWPIGKLFRQFMERDLRPKLGRPGVWLQESDLARIRRWTSRRVGQLG